MQGHAQSPQESPARPPWSYPATVRVTMEVHCSTYRALWPRLLRAAGIASQTTIPSLTEATQGRSARAPAHLTHEPDEALLDRLRLQGPAETLYRTHVHMLSARDQTDAFLQAATHPWMQALQEAWRSATVEGTDRRPHRPDQPSSSAPAISEVLLTPSDRPIATNATPAQTPTIVSNDTQIATLHSAQTPPSQADHAVMDKSAPAGQYACPHCPKSYALLSTLRWRMTKVHKLRMPAITFDRVPQSVDGMPVCARCGESFTRWEVLEAHVVNQRCSGILPTEATVQEPDSTPLALSPGVGTRPGPLDQHSPWIETGPVPSIMPSMQDQLLLPPPSATQTR